MTNLVMQIIEQLLTGLGELQAGQPVTLKIGPETLTLAGKKVSVTEQITIQLAP